MIKVELWAVLKNRRNKQFWMYGKLDNEFYTIWGSVSKGFQFRAQHNKEICEHLKKGKLSRPEFRNDTYGQKENNFLRKNIREQYLLSVLSE